VNPEILAMSGLVNLELLLLLFILGLLSSVFSAMETAFFSLPTFELQRMAETHPALRKVVQKILYQPRRTLNVIVLGDALANVPLVVTALFLLRQNQLVVPIWISSLVLFALIVGLFDLVPKLLAQRQPARVTLLTGPAFIHAATILQPLADALERLSEKISRKVMPQNMQLSRHLSEEELQTLVTLGAEEGALLGIEAEMILEVMKLGDKKVEDVMTPRVEMFGLPDDWSNERAIVELKRKRYRRVPVFGDTPDDVAGILEVRRLMNQPDRPYMELLERPDFIPDTMKAIDLLKLFLTESKSMVLVVDEFGGMEGMVTPSDIIEEIISDAVPRGDRDLYIEEVGDGTLLVSGSARLEDLMELGLPDWQLEGIDTIGGWIFHQNDALPKPGEKLHFEGVTITIRRTSRKRIKDMLIEIEGREAPEEMPQTEQAGTGGEESG